MSDLDALREAVERLDAGRDPWHLSADHQLALAAAARAVLDSEEKWWCNRHDTLGTKHRCPDYGKGFDHWDDKTCSMVRRRLLAEEGM